MPRNKAGSHERIIEAAKKEFLQRGFNGASMRRIAASAGVSASGLYKHFPSKEEIFASLVEDTKKEFERQYRERERREYANIGDGPVARRESTDTRWAVEFIYDHLDAFRLLINKADGTLYANYLHDVAKFEEGATLAYISELRKRGEKPAEISRKELHLLVTAQVNAVFETVKHDFSREEALHYAEMLDRFFMPGWSNVLLTGAPDK